MTIDAHTISPRRTALGLATVFGGLVVTAGLVIGVTAGVGAAWHATNPPGAAPASAAAAAASPDAASVQLTIQDVSTPQGSEPAFVGPNGAGKPVLFSLHAGATTALTIVNKTEEPHTFTSSALGVNVTIPPGPATVHVSLDPKTPGKASWDCSVPCGAWVMAQPGYMTGAVEVLS